MLNAYMGFDRLAGQQEGAVLIFARTAKEARRLGWRYMRDWFDTEWIHMAVCKVRENVEFLRGDANAEKLASDTPHVIETPRCCPNCEAWGGGAPDENGRCDYCYDDYDDA